MFKKTKVCQALMLAFGGGLALGALPALAQQTTQLDRVEITGSSIKRVDAESALPIITITQQDIARSGAVDVTELIQKLPSMQSFLTAASSVNGGGGGATNASIHAIGSQYTLVLLNGRRLAPYNTGTTVNLESIPLAAIDRVEILTDGASAVYGADAIAGVVNFILRKDATDGIVTLTGTLPQRSGGGSNFNFSATKGFGDFDTDKYNILLSASFDKQEELYAQERSFSNTGFRPFSDQGRSLTTFVSSSNSVPGNVILLTPDGQNVAAMFNPYQQQTGNCAPGSRLLNGYCNFDYAGLVDLVPASERASLFGSGRVKVSSDISIFGELALSRYETTPKYAPPAQPGIYLTQALYNNNVAPYLANLGLTPADIAPVGDAAGNGPYMNLRLYDAGNRQDKYQTDTSHIVIGAEGNVGGWDASTYYTHSQNKWTDYAMSGYTSSNAFNDLIASGAFDPLSSPPGTAVGILAPAVLHQALDSSMSSIDVLSLKGSRALMKLDGGDLAMALGAEYMYQRFKDTPSPILQGANALQPNFTDAIIGGGGGALPFDSKRPSYGIFGELVAPLTKALELSGALRYDSYEAVKNSQNFDAAGNPLPTATQGNAASATTYKVGLRFQPIRDLLLRGSYGTGFKAPTLANITSPLQAFGVTSGSYACPFNAQNNPTLAAACPAGTTAQYNILAGGNSNSGSAGLSPEKSTQWTVGFRVEPSPAISVGVDFWNVALKNRIDVIPEQVAFANAAAYANLFTIAADPVTGNQTLTFIQQPQNLGKAIYRGIDLDLVSKVNTSIGSLTMRGAGTYMIKAGYEVPGMPGYQTSLGQFGPDNSVVFRWLLSASATLETGGWANTLAFQFKPSYQDMQVTAASGMARVLNPDGTIGAPVAVTRNVSSYFILDWQTKYDVTKEFAITGGIKNLLDRDPPFSLQNRGGGNQFGYDARYADPYGRQFYVRGTYKF